MLLSRFCGGAVAQLGARLDGIEEVVGSNPIGSTIFVEESFGTLLPFNIRAPLPGQHFLN